MKSYLLLILLILSFTSCDNIMLTKPASNSCNSSWQEVAKVPIIIEANIDTKMNDKNYNIIKLKDIHYLKGFGSNELSVLYPKNKSLQAKKQVIAFINIFENNKYYLDSVCSVKNKKSLVKKINNQKDILLNKKYLKYLKDSKEVDKLIQNISKSNNIDSSVKELLTLGKSATSAIISNLDRYKYTNFNSTLILPNRASNSFEAYAMYKPKTVTSLLLILLDRIENESFYENMLDNQDYINNAINAWYIWIYKKNRDK